MNIRYRVELNEAERTHLTALLNGGKHPARKLKRAQILTAAGVGINDEDIASSVTYQRPYLMTGFAEPAALKALTIEKEESGHGNGRLV